MTTIYDIAEKAGVSGSTVSRALSGSRLVSDDVRERIQALARDLGFEKRSVRRHRARAILNIRLVLPHHADPERGLFFDLGRLIAGLREGFAPTATNLMCDLGGPGFLPFPHKKGGDTDAFVFAFQAPDPAVVAELSERRIPFVVLNRARPGLPCIASDHAHGMRELVRHVTAAGNPVRPCMITIEGMGEIFDERREGLAIALADAGVAFSRDHDVHRFSGIPALRDEPLRKLAHCYDTLFCVNDIVGSAVLAELAHTRIAVPGTCQVTGFDDSPLRRLTRPLLTTVALPVFELACRAGKRLAGEIIDGESPAPLERLQGALLVGDSTRPAPARS